MAIPDPRSEPTISVDRAATLLGVSRATAYKAVRSGAIPSLRIGRRIVVPTAKVLALLGVWNDSVELPAPNMATPDHDGSAA